MEETLAIQAAAMDALGTAQGEMLREQTGIEEADARTAYGVVSRMLEGIGFGTEVVETAAGRVVFRAGTCPIYEAGQVLGLEPSAVEAICRSGGIACMDAVVRQLNPQLRFQLRSFRAAPDEPCEEEIVAVQDGSRAS
jgi:hypothetical protein